jgi:hypothetical protein
MNAMLDVLSRHFTAVWPDAARPGAHRKFTCVCGRPIFFRNSRCLGCQRPLGFDTAGLALRPLMPGPDEGSWVEDRGEGDGAVAPVEPGPTGGTPSAEAGAPADLSSGEVPSWYRCLNFDGPPGCNWLVSKAEHQGGQHLCVACRLNRTIPDLSDPENVTAWRAYELAKRRLVSQLLALGLPVRSKMSEDLRGGLMFDLLRSNPGAHVMTGHDTGLITLNIEEADDAKREAIRGQMREPYRTLLGHFRHEIGHYYWDRLVLHSDWLEPCRALFGDERDDYGAALQRHYEQGAPIDWGQRHVSSYASMHPWEDWAETWAHYLHMVDTLDTALSFGVDLQQLELSIEPYGPDALWDPSAPDADDFLAFVNGWVELTGVLNELSRSMGQHDFYPFVLPRPAVAKLQFIHRVISGARERSASEGTFGPLPAVSEPVSEAAPPAEPLAA